MLRTQIADAQGRLFELASQPDAAKNAPRIARCRREIRTLEAQYQTRSLRAWRPRRRGCRTSSTSTPATLKALQPSMRDEGYEMLQYLVTRHWPSSSGTSRPDSVSVRNVFLPRAEVIDKVAALQKSLADRNARFDETTAQELFLF